LLSLGVVLWGLMGGSASGADLLERVKNQEIAQVLHLRVGHSKVIDKSFQGDEKKPTEIIEDNLLNTATGRGEGG